MSALLPFIKHHQAIGRALHDRARAQLIDNQQPERAALLEEMALAHDAAAADLEAQTQAEATGDGGTTFHSLSGEPRKVGGGKPARGMGS